MSKTPVTVFVDVVYKGLTNNGRITATFLAKNVLDRHKLTVKTDGRRQNPNRARIAVLGNKTYFLFFYLN